MTSKTVIGAALLGFGLVTAGEAIHLLSCEGLSVDG